MTTMINGFLNVSRLESGKIQIDKTQFDILTVLQETEQETLIMFPAHKIIYSPVSSARVNADKEKIGQVINNFISNAVKYSKGGSTIQVSSVKFGNAVQISVKDEGIGIKETDLNHLFERFYRVHYNTHISGFGIGLYLCSEIIKRHEGKIWAESEWGHGSAFHFTLSLAE